MKKIALGFTGLAGIILSLSGAMAADTTVTSKSYVDAQVATREATVNKKTTLTDSDVDFPSTSAVKAAIDAAKEEIAGDIAAIDLTPYEEKSNKVVEITHGTVNSTTLYPSNKALTEYVEYAINDAIGDVEGDTDNRYQRKTTINGYPSVAMEGGLWKKLTKGSYTMVDSEGTNVIVDVDANKLATQASDITATSTNLATAGAVYNYIKNLPAAQIEGHTSACDADHPCTLIDRGNNVFEWVRIAQPGD